MVHKMGDIDFFLAFCAVCIGHRLTMSIYKVWSPVCINEYMLDNCDSLAVVSLKNTLKYCNKLCWLDSQLDYALLLLTLGILEQTR